ncbi:VWA domain-containing protein [Maribacter sp. 2307UL18-2]|uniref:vWA domain-containing protein n=1 Tax=Maribacter sp. 2307UL18-2 TaxID=3386274 RepID=UPI0039BCF8FE
MDNIKKLKYVFYGIVFLCLSCSKDEPLVLGSPMSISATSDSALKVRLSWDTVPNALGYRVFRADASTFGEEMNFVEIGTTEIPEFTDLGVVSNSSYYYRVEAFNGNVLSEQSDMVMGNTKFITLDESFDVLAEYTDGQRYNAESASDVPETIIEIIRENSEIGTDLIFLIDNTSSMADDIRQVKNSINSIISELPEGTRLGIATYNDANTTSEWYQWVNLDSNYDNAITFLNSIRVFGGGDIPESVYDGIQFTLSQMDWSSSSKRMMVVIGDAPPLEGSRSAFSLKEVIDSTKEFGVAVNLFPILIRD